jgi:hypothetical protein
MGKEASAGFGANANDTNEAGSARHRVRLPHFIVHKPVGAGQVVRNITNAVGVRPCAPCERRADRLDRWLQIEPRL